MGKANYHEKSAQNPKGAGRPKGTPNKRPNIKLIEAAVLEVYGGEGKDLNKAKVKLLSDYLRTAGDKGKQYIIERVFGKAVDASKVHEERKQTDVRKAGKVEDLFNEEEG